MEGTYLSRGGSDYLVDDDTNRNPDVFVHDRITHKTELVSRRSDTTIGNTFSYSPQISEDGRYVALLSLSNLVYTDSNNLIDVYVRDSS